MSKYNKDNRTPEQRNPLLNMFNFENLDLRNSLINPYADEFEGRIDYKDKARRQYTRPRLTEDELYLTFLDYKDIKGYRIDDDKGSKLRYNTITLAGFTSYLQERGIIGRGVKKYFYNLPAKYDEVKDDIYNALEAHNQQSIANGDTKSSWGIFLMKNTHGYKDKTEQEITVADPTSKFTNEELEAIALGDSALQSDDKELNE